MAQADFDAFAPNGVSVSSGGLGRVFNIIGAASSIALVLGVAWWGYKLAVRDVNGVPVIQAMQGPMRVAPDDPGGQIADHTGLAVNRIAAEGVAGDIPERITLAPGAVTLSEEDTPGIGAATLVVPAPRPAGQDPAQGIVASLAVVDQLTSGLTTIEAASAFASAAPSISVRPRPRPARSAQAETVAASNDAVSVVAAAAAAAVVAALAEPTSARVADSTGAQNQGALGPAPTASPFGLDPAALTEGTRLAQIGAFDDEAGALREWDRLAALNPEAFADKSRVIQTATSAGRTFYRLRVHGFASEEASRAFCTTIEAPDLRCIPVIHR